MTNPIPAEKVRQAAGILDELDLDGWLTFVRETTETGDPILPLILGQPLTWQSALLITRRGDAIAIVGKYEDDAVRSTGAWAEVIPYVEGIAAPLRETLARLDPASIGINVSESDVKADGLTVGLHRVLLGHLEGTPYRDRLTSAERAAGALRGRKTPSELARIEAAIAAGDAIFEQVARDAAPGTTEAEVARRMHALADEGGMETAWEREQCPIVTTGPGSMVGHGIPSDTLAVRRGMVFHLDFGVRRDDYCSDIQRCWWVPRAAGDDAIDPIVTRCFDAVRDSIRAAFAALRPGAVLHEVDAAARSTLVGRGFPEYGHATGHQVGRAAHDGGGVIGPRWERYGDATSRTAEPGEVWTLELGVDLEDHGYLGLEEMVVVEQDGCRWLSTPQETLPVLPAAAG